MKRYILGWFLCAGFVPLVQAQTVNVSTTGGLLYVGDLDDDSVPYWQAGIERAIYPRLQLGVGYLAIKYEEQAWAYPYLRVRVLGEQPLQVYLKTGAPFLTVGATNARFSNRATLAGWMTWGVSAEVGRVALLVEAQYAKFPIDDAYWSAAGMGVQVRI